MTQSLLIVAWPYEDQVLTSFRYADGYTMPVEYTGNATLTQIRSAVDDTGYEVLYRCQGCFSWDQDGVPGSVSTSKGSLVAGRAQGSIVPENPQCPSEITYEFHDDGFAQTGLPLDDAPNEAYEEWAALATNDVPGSCDGTDPPTETEDPSGTGTAEPDPTATDPPEETEGESKPPLSTVRPSTSPSREPSEPATPTHHSWPHWPKFGWPKWPKPSWPSWPHDPWDDSGDDSPWDDSRDDPWDDFWDSPWDESPDPWDDSWDEEPEESTFWPGPEEPTENTRPPRPTPTFWPVPSGPEEPPPDPEESSDPSATSKPDQSSEDSHPTYPTPTFWPDPWAPDEPSGEETVQPSETRSPTEAETPEVSFTIADPLEPPLSSDLESPVVTEEPVETEEPVGTAAEEIEEPVETDNPEEPIETDTPEPVECTAVGEDETFDYVVVGAGAGGITVAQRLTEAGNKVVLLEKGPPSLARWGGDMKPEWLENEELTRFDVPGLCNQVWQDSVGTCTDMDQIAGCVLGGGTAVNAGLWWEVSLNSSLLLYSSGI